jgi:hypothetical protein
MSAASPVPTAPDPTERVEANASIPDPTGGGDEMQASPLLGEESGDLVVS